MKKTLFSIICIFTFTLIGCVNEEEKTNLELDEKSDTYIFKSIEFYLAEGDGVTNIQMELPKKVIDNYTNASGSIIVNQHEGVVETSTFKSEELLSYNFKVNDSIRISLPDMIIGDGYISSGIQRVKFSNYETEVFPLKATKSTYSITPYVKLTVERIALFYEMKTSYSAMLIGEKTGKVIYIKGKWEGSILDYVYCKGRWENLE